jgi:hypothetical protein
MPEPLYPASAEDALPLGGLSPEQQAALVRQLAQELQGLKDRRKPLERVWKACQDAYEGSTAELKASLETDRNAIARPIVFQAVENLHATLMGQLFPESGQFFHVLGQTAEDHTHAQQIEQLLRIKLQQQGFQAAFSLLLKQVLITGTGVMMLPWVYRHGTQMRRVPVKRLGVTVGHETRETPVVLEQGPRFEVLNPLDVYFDDTLQDWQEGRLFRRIAKKAGHILNEPRYQGLEHVQHGLARLRDTAEFRLAHPQGLMLEEMPLTLIEVWGSMNVGSRLYSHYVVVYVEETGTLLRFEPHGLELGEPPFWVARLNPQPQKGYGLGVVEKSLGLQQAINTLTNQKLDILNLCINAPFTYLLSDDVFNPQSLDHRPGALVPVKDHDTLRPLPLVAQNLNVAFQEIEDLKIEVMETTGSLRLMSGLFEGHQQAPRTATEVNTLTQNAHRKYDGMLMQLEQQCLEPILNRVYRLCRQFWVHPETYRHGGNSLEHPPAFDDIHPDVLRYACCDIKVTGHRGALNEEQALESLMFLLKLKGEMPELLPRLDEEKIAKRIMHHLGFTAEELLRPENPPAQPHAAGSVPSTPPTFRPTLPQRPAL